MTAPDPRSVRRRVRRAVNDARVQRHLAWQQRMRALAMRMRAKA